MKTLVISKPFAVLVLAVGLAFAATQSFAQPRSILPPLPGTNDNGGGFQPQPVPPAPAPQFNPPQVNPPQDTLPPVLPGQSQNTGTGQGILGTLPVAPPGEVGQAPAGGGNAVVDGVYAPLFGKITGPMPTAGTQSTLRDLLLDTRFRGIRGADGLARARALYRLGFIEDATGAVIEIEGQGVTRLAATATMFLAMGRTGQACGVADVSDLPKGAAPAPTFALLEVLAFCKFQAGDKKAAKLITAILRDQGGGDALFRALMAGALKGRKPKINVRRAKTMRPIHVALFATTGLPIPDGLVAKADLAVLAEIARKSANPGLLLAITERLVATGLATFSELDALYAEIAPPDFDPATALKSKTTRSAIGRASIYRLLDEIDDDQTRMALAVAAYEAARKTGAGAAAAVLFSDIVITIVPRPELARFASSAARLLFDADRPDIAAGWIAAGEFAEDGKARLKPVQAHKLKAIAAILAPEAGFGLGSGTLGSDISAIRLSRADRAFVSAGIRLMAALGDEVPQVLAKIGGGASPPAAGAVSIGPVKAIEALVPLSGKKIGKVKLKQLTGAISALRGLGLEGEARRLAADNLMARL
ncbi:MAG: hypothetical protein ACC634_02425 [Hyphomicrobiales bacterium]